MAVDFKAILSVTLGALNAVTKLGAVPGVSMIPYVSTITGAAGLLQFALEKGVNIAGDLAVLKNTFSEDGLPTQEQMDALNARLAALRVKVRAPLPPKEDGEPD